MEQGAELKTSDAYGQTPLSKAATKGHEETMRLLLLKGANVETKDSVQLMPQEWAQRLAHTRVVALLVLAGATRRRVKA